MSEKEHGGFTLAQAEFDETAVSGMPRSAALLFIPGKRTATPRLNPPVSRARALEVADYQYRRPH